MAAGVIGVSSGLSPLEVLLFALIMYAGSAQFITCGLLVTGAPFSVIILTVFIVNLRHLLLSLTIAPYCTQYTFRQHIGVGALLTDETFGVASLKINRGIPFTVQWFNGLNLCAYVAWAFFCLLGALCGSLIPQPERFGLDFALTAMFVALLVLQIQSIPHKKIRHSLFIVFCVIGSMYGFSLFMPSHLAVIFSTIVVATIGVITEK